jgi:hypothetical protein
MGYRPPEPAPPPPSSTGILGELGIDPGTTVAKTARPEQRPPKPIAPRSVEYVKGSLPGPEHGKLMVLDGGVTYRPLIPWWLIAAVAAGAGWAAGKFF